ncbi:MAG: phage tail protein I, partial [Pseudomonadota bacterium]
MSISPRLLLIFLCPFPRRHIAPQPPLHWVAPMSDTLLPPKTTPLQRAVERTLLQEVSIEVPTRTLWNPDDCPEHLLPWLAWSVSVNRW